MRTAHIRAQEGLKQNQVQVIFGPDSQTQNGLIQLGEGGAPVRPPLSSRRRIEATTTAVPLTFEIIGVEFIFGKSPLLAIAVVKLVLSGVVFTVEGVKVSRTLEGGMEVRSPVFRHPKGGLLPTVLLPPELAVALTREVADRLSDAIGPAKTRKD